MTKVPLCSLFSSNKSLGEGEKPLMLTGHQFEARVAATQPKIDAQPRKKPKVAVACYR